MEEIVHIILVGYKIDRVVKAFEVENEFQANKVYLLWFCQFVD